ncbi:MAG: tetratricopeptide repeat protein [Pseudobdellovibrionaceae bacterium]
MMSSEESSEFLQTSREAFIAGQYQQAEPLLQQMILRGTRNPEVYQMLATIAYDRGQFSKAIKTFRRALEIDPSYTDASVGLSIILNDLGKYEEGKKVFEDAQIALERRKGKVDPLVEEKLATKHEELADLYFQHNRYKEALEQLYKALRLSSRKTEVTLRIVECFVKLGQYDKAIKDLRLLIKDYPQFIPARLKLGTIYYSLNQVAEATEQWESILLRDPENTEAQKHLKMAQAAGLTSLSGSGLNL